ncbi:MAG: hypothetical protein QM504_17440 [Pseudomonadota bacterium]
MADLNAQPKNLSDNNVNRDLSNILDLNTLINTHPQFTLNQMRWFIQQRAINNLEASGALFKAGKRWFFDVPLFIQWLKHGDRG